MRLFPVFLRKVTKYGANGEKQMHQLSFPCRHHLSRTYPATLAHLRLRRCVPASPSRAPTPMPLRTCAYAAAHKRHHSRASAPPHSRICAYAAAHPHTYSHAPSSSIYTHWRPPLRTFVLPSLFRSLSESIRIYPSLSDILREISMGPD